MTRDSVELATGVRELTDDEVAFYFEHGWVKLERLVDPELAAEMLRAGSSIAEQERYLPGAIFDTEFGFAERGEEPFRSVVMSETMGKNAQRLINRRRLNDADIPVRYRQDVMICKRRGDQATPRHQDWSAHAPDRGGEMMFWVALNEVTPEMGSMSFLSGSHREGPLGMPHEKGKDLLAVYPKLPDLYQASPQMHYQPGDATVHHGWTIHSTTPNLTERPRFGYIMMYSPADIRYFKGHERGKSLSVADGVLLDDEWFNKPIVYPKSSDPSV